MKKITPIICFLLIFFTSCIFVGCGSKPESKNTLNVSFSDLQTISTSAEPRIWSKISATRIDADGTENVLINKTGGSVSPIGWMNEPIMRANNVKVDYVKENNNEKVYCKDNVRHHKGKDNKGRDRNYIDESEFDGQAFINEVVFTYLEELYNFFDKDNSNLLTYSNKIVENSTTTFEFKAIIDKSNNTTLRVKLIFEDDALIKIKVEIKSNDKTKEILVELFETTEVVNTPEWFDSDEFKTPMTYEQVKAVVLEEDFEDWDSAELFLPVGYSDDTEDKQVFTSKSQNKTYTITDTNKQYFDGTHLYSYINDEPESKQDISNNDTQRQKYIFDNIINEYKTFTYGYFFAYETQYEEYYQAAKKYEKDITVVSYKYFGVSGNVKFEAICSLYYDIDNNLYQILCYAKQINISDPQNEILMFEMNLSLQKTNEFSTPIWFNASDFE